MAWTTPRTWTTGEVVTATMMNAHVRDNLTDLDTRATVATGMVFPYAGTAAPTGYLLCDGAAVSRTTYAALFAVTGTAFGAGNGSTTFNVPNLLGRYLVGIPSAGTRGSAVGTALTDGENRATGQHAHDGYDTGADTGTRSPVGGWTFATVASTETNATKNAGSVAGTNAPYLQMHFVIKT